MALVWDLLEPLGRTLRNTLVLDEYSLDIERMVTLYSGPIQFPRKMELAFSPTRTRDQAAIRSPTIGLAMGLVKLK